MLCLRTEGPYGSGLQVKNLGRDETTHESKGHHSVPPSSVSVLVSQFVSDCSISESNNKYHRFGNDFAAQIDVGGSVKESSKDQSRPVSLELGNLDLENVQQSQVNKDRVVLGTNSGYSKLPRRSRGKSSLVTVTGLINGNLVAALIDSGCEVECVLSIKCAYRVGIAHRNSTLRAGRWEGSLTDLKKATQTLTLNLGGQLGVKS
jgi:hypothetical protein